MWQVLDREILPYLTKGMQAFMRDMSDSFLQEIQEIRVRGGRPLAFGLGQGDYLTAYPVTLEELKTILNLLSRSSLYALEEELRNGYLTLPGGHRVGFVGRAVLEKGAVKLLKDISGFNIRISRECKGSADSLIPYLIDSQKKSVLHTLLVAPPQAGKTTMLRDLARQLSDGQKAFAGQKVAIVDERSEIAASYQGVAQREIGLRTDVLDGCPKAAGMMLLVRSMSPDIIITDEIGREEDVAALEEVLNAGVTIITSVHGNSLADLEKRPSMMRILEHQIFERFVFLSRRCGAGTVEKILDRNGSVLQRCS